jgi:hypothetical protein
VKKPLAKSSPAEKSGENAKPARGFPMRQHTPLKRFITKFLTPYPRGDKRFSLLKGLS